MKKIIELHVNVKHGKESEKVFDWLIDRAVQYLEFIRENAIESHKEEWCERIIAVLKFLGDYKLDKDIKSID